MQRRSALVVVAAVLAVAAGLLPGAATGTQAATRYVVVLAGEETDGGFTLAGTRTAVLTLVGAAGGTVVHDLSSQIGVLVVDSANALFAETLRSSPLVDEAAEDFGWKAFPSRDEAIASGALTVLGPDDAPPGGGPEAHADPLESLQWGMQMIRAPEAHAVQAGSRLVEVGILDTGIDGAHLDFADGDGTNVNCAKGRDFIPAGPGVGLPTPCVDNNFHGTHVAGIVAARANGHGVVGVAPNVELIPIKVCDADGHCYASSTAAGITYAGDAKLEVINMSFYVDDDQFQQSTEFKCMSDPVQRAFRQANERAVRYARKQGVVPVAALGNSDHDLANPPEPYENECEVVPAETEGVIGTVALGPAGEKARYSNYGVGAADVSAPGGNWSAIQDGPGQACSKQILSTIPGNVWGCFQGTSMASPHAAGVAALIVSQFGRVANDGGVPDVVMRPQDVESHLQATAIDIGLQGYDECFGNGRVDALRAVLKDTSRVHQPNHCPEYDE